MRTNAAGLEIIRHFEGLRLTAYRCPAGIWTIGYGHTGPEVSWGMKITAEQAEQLLQVDVVRMERAIEALVDVELSENEFSALVALTYNIGSANFASSTLLADLNAGNRAGAALEFGRWIHSKGKVLPGLVERRDAEKALFLSL